MEALTAILLGLGGAIAIGAYLLVLEALFPQVVAATARAASDAPGRSLTLGVVNALFLTVVMVAFGALADSVGSGILATPAVVAAGALLVLASFGLSGTGRLIGARLFGHRRWPSVWGTMILVVASLAPVVGWFGLLPYVALLGAGGFVLGWLVPRRRRSRRAAEESPPDNPPDNPAEAATGPGPGPRGGQ